MHLNQLSCPGAWLKVEVSAIILFISAIILFIYMICPGHGLVFSQGQRLLGLLKTFLITSL